jgi:YD repeat-containing protein
MEQEVGTQADPMSAVTVWEYDALGNVTAETDPLGLRTTFDYDARNLVTSIKTPDGPRGSSSFAVTTYSYDAAGQLSEMETPLGHRVTYTYDLVGRQLTETVETGSEALTSSWDYSYEDVNFRVDATDRNGITTSTISDANDRVIRIIDPRNGDTDITYYPNGMVKTRTNGPISVAFTYDGLNRVETVVDGEGGVTTTEYDETFNVLSRTDAIGNTVEYTYD